MEEKLPQKAGVTAVAPDANAPGASNPDPVAAPDPAVPAAQVQIPVVVQPAPQSKARNSKELLKSADFYIFMGVLGAVILVGAMVIHFMDRWRRRQDSSECEAPLTLSAFREMYENGEITLSEYEKILKKMAKKIKKDVGIKDERVQMTPPPTNNAAPTEPFSDGSNTDTKPL